MSFTSLPFLVALLLLSAVFFYLPWQWRGRILAAWNAAFLYMLIPNDASWIVLGLFLLSGYAVAQLLCKWPSRLLLSAYIIALVAAFSVIRRYDLVTAELPESLTSHVVGIVGLSYMLFRQIALVVDASQGQIERMSLWTYANYQLNLFTLLSGPIQRYQDFHDQWEKLEPVLEDDHAVRMAYLRLLTGIIKLAVVATIFLSLYNRSADALAQSEGGASELARPEVIGHF